MKYLLILALLLSGCSDIKLKAPTGEELRYFRFGPQKLSDVVLEIPGYKLSIGKQEADVKAVVESLAGLVDSIK